MFLHVFFSVQEGGVSITLCNGTVGCIHPTMQWGWRVHPEGGTPIWNAPLPEDRRSTGGRYASYWNAFLFSFCAYLPEVLMFIKSSHCCDPPVGEEQYLHSPIYSLRSTVSGLVSAQLGAPKDTRYVNKPNMRHKAEILGHGEPSIKPIAAYILVFLL